MEISGKEAHLLFIHYFVYIQCFFFASSILHPAKIENPKKGKKYYRLRKKNKKNRCKKPRTLLASGISCQ